MTSTKTNLLIFVAMLSSASSLVSMQLVKKINNHKNNSLTLFRRDNHVRIINNHHDQIFILLKKNNKDYGHTHAIEPYKELTLPCKNDDNENVTCTALMMGPIIINFLEFPLKKNVAEQSVTFNFHFPTQCLSVKNNRKIIKLLSRFQNEKLTNIF